MSHSPKSAIPQASRPYIKGYGIPESQAGMLPWSFVVAQMQGARNYWVATATPDGRPHAVAVWGVWLDDTIHFGGGPDTRWSRNLARNPYVVVHLESGNEVVMMEGTVTRITDPTSEIMKRLDDEYEVKYQMRHGPPIWVLQPHKVFAWKEFPTSVTRWVFDATQ